MTGQPHSWLQNLGIAIEVIFPALSFIFTAARVYLRLKTNTFGWDDACIILATLLAVALAVGSILCMKYLYIGIHYWDVPKDYDLEDGLIWTYVVGAVYNPILAIVKQSVLAFLLRLAGTKPAVRVVIWATIAFNAALMIAVFLVVIFQCHPIEYNWNLAIQGECVDQLAFGISTACLTILTDVIALALPFYIFLGLQIAKKTKLALLVVFLLGFIVTIVSVVRLYFLYQHSADASDPDVNYSLGFCVSAIEVNLAIIAACCPALWPMIRSWMPRLFGSSGRSTQGYHQNHGTDWMPGRTNRRTDVSGNLASRLGGGGGTMASRGGKVANSHIVLRDLKDPRGRLEQDSDEEVLTHNGEGILRVTQYTVTHDNESRAGTQGGGITSHASKGSSLSSS